ncbi:MAG: NAD(P)H-dependent glycerol-3-phosphate dehydrogenase [Candidatus Margulisiibacteriota bacterium]
MSKCAVIGAGAWGTTLSVLLAEGGHKVALWSYETDLVPEMKKYRENKKYLSGFPLPETIEIESSLERSLSGAELVVLAVPTQHLRSQLQAVKIDPAALIISASKGLEEKTLKRPTEIIGEYFKGEIAALSGPNLAREIAEGKPAAAVVTAERAQKFLMRDRFRIYTNTDVIGVELGGALKNIIAIASGCADGLGLGNNAKSALLVRGLAEITRLGVALGARAETFFGLSGMGDLITTCESVLSRNHRVGFEIAKGKRPAEIMSSMKEVAEGVPTARAALELARKIKVIMPITEQVNRVLFEGLDPYQALAGLMTRTPASE